MKNLDFGIDAIAIRLGFWNWVNGGEYYGVPISNFFAWYIVGGAFSLCIRWVGFYLKTFSQFHKILLILLF